MVGTKPDMPKAPQAVERATPVSDTPAATEKPTIPTAPAKPQAETAQQQQDEPDSEMFEQNVTAPQPQQVTQPAAVQQSSMSQATRYGDSFIPPRPVEAAQPSAQLEAPPPQAEVTPTPEPAPQAVSPAPLTPPRLHHQGEPKKAPSLFERFTGSLSAQKEDGQVSSQVSAPAPSLSAQRAAPVQQGSLNIAPTAQPKAAQDDELDIPAFLRRQAN